MVSQTFANNWIESQDLPQFSLSYFECFVDISKQKPCLIELNRVQNDSKMYLVEMEGFEPMINYGQIEQHFTLINR
jgi:hypothetical protein